MTWISVEERLPKIGEEVLLFSAGFQRTFLGWKNTSGEFQTADRGIKGRSPHYRISHWTPLPDPPEAGDGE